MNAKFTPGLSAGHLPFTRRNFLRTAGGLAMVGALPSISLASNPVGQKLHGLSAFGELKYPENFTQFDYANTDAPRGGRFAFSVSYWYFNQNPQTFNTLNSFVLKGEAPPRMEACFDTLMVWAYDEPDALYCALAESVEISKDRNAYRFALRPEAKFSDGRPVTAQDVAFSYLTLKEKGHPQVAIDLAELDEVIVHDERTLTLRFTGEQSDRAILSIANSVPILSARFYQDLAFEDHVMEIPVGSGAYRVGDFDAGRYIEYVRRDDYWAKDMPFARGLNHFDMLRIDFFRERQAAFEAFKKGVVRWRQEFTSKTWATEYNFPAVEAGSVVLTEMPGEKRPSLQGWAVNSRWKKFADRRTREAIGLCFDFAWTNKNLFYGAYERSHSMFEKSDYAAQAAPSDAELELLEALRADLPETVFGDAVRQFETDGSGRDRSALRRSRKLLREAGWQERDGNLYLEDGTRLDIEFLIRSPVFERVLGPYVENLKTIGIPATIRLVDPSQFQARLETFDYDVVGLANSFGATPTREAMRQFFHSSSANREGSRNYPGIALEPLDDLIDRIEGVQSREELQTVMKCVDRVLRAYHFWIPNWHSANHRIAMWDMFGWPDAKPDYFFPVEQLWWIDPDKAATIESRL
jgi:microcin C transport system substrate-binding protein